MRDNITWQALHNQLRDGLQKEIHLTRELLSNLNQEEVSRMLDDSGSVNYLLEQQHSLFERLSIVRTQRMQLTTAIEKIVLDNHKLPSLDEVLPPAEEISTEILFLTDQLVALTERLNRQHSHNQQVIARGAHHPHFHAQMAPKAKRKASVATYHLKK